MNTDKHGWVFLRVTAGSDLSGKAEFGTILLRTDLCPFVSICGCI